MRSDPMVARHLDTMLGDGGPMFWVSTDTCLRAFLLHLRRRGRKGNHRPWGADSPLASLPAFWERLLGDPQRGGLGNYPEPWDDVRKEAP